LLWVGALGVVDDAEGGEEVLQLAGGGWSWSCSGLVEAFDFALGLGMAGMSVFLGDVQVKLTWRPCAG
jgi:hypothetical protein